MSVKTSKGFNTKETKDITWHKDLERRYEGPKIVVTRRFF